ncbi:MAG: dihydrolipoamide acetyltransferase [Pelagibacteraceae bacterium TMED124]|nr:dihydrolipoamide acetyltransferase [Candidatus Neomarinimicrobiota bacterium]RPG19311.1 MAG: dihydrolipoamide acetyltransferase [Pelagibacteraceae bacterium TMED124]|tara:strand:+ start:2627 stop:3988 length:1362 start_codon:yes stop_codon:yes gene_type:complete
MNIILPQLGEGIDKVEVTDVFFSKGDSVKFNDILIVVESDKASMEIPIEESGTIAQILIAKGDLIKPGDIIAEITNDTTSTDKDDLNDSKNKNPENNSITEEGAPIKEQDITENDRLNTPEKLNSFKKTIDIITTPSVRKLARELGCNLNNITGSEKNNRITKQDVLEYVKKNVEEKKMTSPNQIEDESKSDNYSNQSNPDHKVKKTHNEKTDSKINEKQFLKFGSIEKVMFNNIRKATSEKMTKSWNTIPHVTHFDEVPIDYILNLKQEIQSATDSNKISILTFIIKSLIKTLTVMRNFNSTIDIENDILIIKNYINLGIAVDTPNGLVVPSLKNIEKKSLKEINDSIIQISNKARTKKVSIEDLSDGTFTISSLGGIGGKFFTPIINYPEVAIMGISRIYTKLGLDYNNLPYETKILPFSLSYDHRVIDGAEAARFCNLFKKNITNLSSHE